MVLYNTTSQSCHSGFLLATEILSIFDDAMGSQFQSVMSHPKREKQNIKLVGHSKKNSSSKGNTMSAL